MDLLGLAPSADALNQYIDRLCKLASVQNTEPEVKAYSDAVYFNYFPLGVSLLFSPINGYKPTTGAQRTVLRDKDLLLDSIDIYNIPKTKPAANKGSSTRKAELAFATYLDLPITLRSTFAVGPETTGKDFVEALGEPARKGGGAGPSSGSIGIWCEWTKDGVMVEFGGIEATGAQAWERGKDACTCFVPPPSMAVPQEFQSLDITGKFTMNKVDSPFLDKPTDIQSDTDFVGRDGQHPGIARCWLTITGGIPGTREERHLTWTERSHNDHLFGYVVGKSRRVNVAELDEDFLKNNWTADTIEHGVIQSYVESDTPKSGTSWIANQTWGIQEINGERRYARNVKFTGPNGEDIERLLVYDYLGPL
ncbi:hypothetical protein HMN09_00621900 [Mycena chlorophos]|uniref:Uncharacterized protein n=1 Tax=Mycena chlorophos TaxID=658473 RepID=A0A8H6T4N8_MYCCL|nr:hypothetical protein HMN09_00621900 [Mycena chlorophos]